MTLGTLLLAVAQIAAADSLLCSKVNSRFALSADIFGEWVGPDGDEKSQYRVSRVEIRKAGFSNGVEQRFVEPIASFGMTGACWTVWSPDEEYVALPRDGFEGFSISPVRSLPTTSSNKPLSDSVAVRYRQRPRSVWHNFRGWSGDHTLLFYVEIDNSRIPFAYDVKHKALTSPVAPILVLDAVNESAAVMIIWGR
ncbi:hypothetical protein OU994_20075 [Pseudoduganella sp. SL102]|uniref:hypothetical protein n=1 Tax=Pseudoduganella sp. SL102 TaxID=2995154 RepID=UPI00248C344A|nr:hypothetical protein [Pseudoduganella sp. SL102]WBS00606.1 hypothetical protein OU994_20075 [Pseudoduganella sp. SL102]